MDSTASDAAVLRLDQVSADAAVGLRAGGTARAAGATLTADAIAVDIAPGSKRGGWQLLQGQLLRRAGPYDARLYWDDGRGWSRQRSFAIPTSVKGAIQEVLLLPAGTQRAAFDPGPGTPRELGPVVLTPLDGLQRRWRMLRRVAAQLWLQPGPTRRRLGLTWRCALSDLTQAYELASRLLAHAAAPDYAAWCERFDHFNSQEAERIAAQIAGWRSRPFFHVLLIGGDEAARSRSLASLDAQLFRDFACTLADGCASLQRFNAALRSAAPGEWAILLHAGDELAPLALYRIASHGLRRPGAVVIYGDEDALDSSGKRCDPRFKPDWSWSYARSAWFFGAATAMDAQTLARAGGVAEPEGRYGCYGAVLRTVDAAASTDDAAVSHVPAVLLHRQSSAGAADDAAGDAWCRAAVQDHLARRGLAGRVQPAGAGVWRVRWPLPDPAPRVSIVVPTRDALALTRRCIESLRTLTRYPHYEVLLVDNQSTDPAALAWMEAQAAQGVLRLLRYPHAFNYSAINNMAVGQAQGEFVCLLNNDTEITQPEWLEEMVVQLLQPGVEIVGAKLLYASGLVQHAGDLVGVGGVANHAHAWLEADAPGYCARAVVPQEYSAVTGACLLTRRVRYLALGGLDERHLPVAFNDVDYCLRVREAGGKVVWTPHAQLVHHESVSRGRDVTGSQRRRARREAAYMRRRWSGVLRRDPFYNPNLSRERPDFSLSHAPVIEPPWLP